MEELKGVWVTSIGRPISSVRLPLPGLCCSSARLFHFLLLEFKQGVVPQYTRSLLILCRSDT